MQLLFVGLTVFEKNTKKLLCDVISDFMMPSTWTDRATPQLRGSVLLLLFVGLTVFEKNTKKLFYDVISDVLMTSST